MFYKWLFGFAALASFPPPVAAQEFPPEAILSFGMPTREFAPGVLVFYADPYGPMQYQSLYVRSWIGIYKKEVEVVVEESCKSAVKPEVSFSYIGIIGVKPGAAGVQTCSLSILRDGQSLGTVRVFINVGPNARGGTAANIAAPNTLTFPRADAFPMGPQALMSPQTVTVTAASFYATVTRLSPWSYFGSNALATVGRSSVGVSVNVPSYRADDQQYLYIETATGVEVVRMNFRERTDTRLVVDPPTINLRYSNTGLDPTATFKVSDLLNAGISAMVTPSMPWLKLSPVGQQMTPINYTLTVDPAGLPDGLNTASLTVKSPLDSASLTVPVVVQVTGSATPAGGLAIAPLSIEIRADADGPSAPGQVVSVRSATAADYTAVGSTFSGGKWLVVWPYSNLNTAANPTFQIIANHTGLAAGTYRGEVKVTATQSQFSRTIPVTLTVTAATPPPPPAITLSTSALAFTSREGAPAPAPSSVQVGGTSGLSFTARADPGWLTVTPASGITSAGTTLTVAANPAGLAPGLYNGRVIVEGSGVSASLAVSFEVSALLPTIAKVCNAASYSTGPIAAGEIVTIFGENLGPAAGVSFTMTAAGRIATSAGGVEVTIGGSSAPILYAGQGQVSAIVPYEIVSPFVRFPAVIVKYRGQSSNGFPMTQASASPGIFTADSSGKGRGAILNADYSPNSPDHPAERGGIVQIFVTGEGQTSPPGVTGAITTVSATGPLTPQPLQAVSVTIDGHPATVHFYGSAPDLVSGLLQLNVEIPAAARSGDVPVVVTIGSEPDQHSSQPDVTVSVR